MKFNYPETGYPFLRDQKTFEKTAKERINAFFNEKKVKEFLKEPLTLELVFSKDNEMTLILPNGEVFAMTIAEICAEFEKLTEELKNI